MKKPTRTVCGILMTMLCIGGCSNKTQDSWEEHNATRTFRSGSVMPRTNSLMWYMIGRSHAYGSFAPISPTGRFSSPTLSRTSGALSVGKAFSVPAGSVKGGSFSTGFSAGS